MKTSLIFKIQLTTLLVLTTVITSFCVKEPAKFTEISFWAMGAEGEQISKLIPVFEQEYPEIRIKVQSIPWGAAHEKLLTAFAGQATPDICQLGNTWIPEFQAIDGIVNLDSLVEHSFITENSYFKGIWKTNIINESVYGIPWYVDTRTLFYRTDILKEVGYDHPPKDWNEWLDVSQKIKKLNNDSKHHYAVFFSTIFNDWAVPVIMILANNGILLKQNNAFAAFDNQATVEALRYYIAFFKEELAVRNMTEVSNIYQGFADGLFSMFITGPWNINELRKRNPELDGRWDTARIPTQKKCASIAGGASLVIFKNCKHVQSAWKFIEFLSRPDIQVEFFKLTHDLPAVKSAWNADVISSDKEIHAFYEQLQHVIPTPKIAEWEQIAVKIQEHLEVVIYGQKTLEEAIDDLNKDVNRILEKRRWLLSKNLIDN